MREPDEPNFDVDTYLDRLERESLYYADPDNKRTRKATITLKDARRKIRKFIEDSDKGKNANINILKVRQGVGKTYAICEYCSDKKKKLILTKQHKHIEKEILPLFAKFGAQKVNHWKSFEDRCKKHIDPDSKDKDRIDELYKFIPPRYICPHICRRKPKDCEYQKQFTEERNKGIVVAAIESSAIPQASKFDGIFVDENIEKWNEFNYIFTDSKIHEITDLDSYREILVKYNQEAPKRRHRVISETYVELTFPVLQHILLVFNETVSKSSALKKWGTIDAVKRNAYCISKDSKSENALLVWHVDKIGVDDSLERQFRLGVLETPEGSLFSKNLTTKQVLTRLRNFAVAQNNLTVAKNLTLLLNAIDMVEFVIYNKPSVIINEKLIVGPEPKTEMGTVFLDPHKAKAFFTYYTHQWDKLFELSEDQNIMMVCATFNEQLFEILMSRYLEKPTTIWKPKYVVEGLKERLQPYISIIYHVARKPQGSWAKSSLEKTRSDNSIIVGESILQNYIIPLIQENPDKTGIVSHKGFEEMIARNLSKNLPTNWMKDHFMYWRGGGLEGSNRFKDYERLILFSTPNVPPSLIIQEYMKLYGSLPEGLEFDEERGSTIIPFKMLDIYEGSLIGYKDKRLMFIYQYIVESKIIDAIHRLRGLDEQRKEVWLFCNIPFNLMDYFEMEFTDTQKLFADNLVMKKNFLKWFDKQLNDKDKLNISDICSHWSIQESDCRHLLKEIKRRKVFDITLQSGQVWLKQKPGLSKGRKLDERTSIKKRRKDIQEIVLNHLNIKTPTSTEELITIMADKPEYFVRKILNEMSSIGDIKRILVSNKPRTYGWLKKEA